MKKKSDNLLYIFIFSTGFIFGLIFFKIDLSLIEPKISLSDLLSLLVTSSIGIYLGKQIQEYHSSARFEKEFLMNEIIKIRQLIDSDKCFKNFNNISFEDIKGSFKELNIQITNLEATFSDSIYSNQINSQGVRKKFNQFRRVVLNISPKENLINPSAQELIHINKEYKDFRRELFKLIVLIN